MIVYVIVHFHLKGSNKFILILLVSRDNVKNRNRSGIFNSITNFFSKKIESKYCCIEEESISEKTVTIEPLSLTQEQIDEIHEKGKLTPKEAVEEWEDYGLCPPSSVYHDVINNRCPKFRSNCHNCLVDYANKSIEHSSFFEDIVSPVKKKIKNIKR